MLFKLLVLFVLSMSAIGIAAGQNPGDEGAINKAKPPVASPRERPRDLPFPSGVDLQFIVKELARDMDLNVLFDPESFRGPRKVSIELKNVTSPAALNYILLQEGLVLEEVGPKTIFIASRLRGTWIPQMGVGLTPMSQQLADYFGASGAGILINNVHDDSPAAKAGLKAGDVILGLDGGNVLRGPAGLMQAVEKIDGDIIVRIVRDRKEETVTVKRVRE